MMSEKTPVQVVLAIPGNMAFLEIALSCIVQCAELYGVAGKELDLIRLGSEEAISNIIQHALANNPEESLNIVCLSRAGHFEIILHEKGQPFDPATSMTYNPEDIHLDGSTSGLGMHLMKKVMDEVHFVNLGRDGKETRLVKYLIANRIDRLIDMSGPAPEAAAAPDTCFHLRLFQDCDAIEISKCAYQAYGYSYEPYIYYPEKIKQMNHDGTMKSLVVVTDKNELAGHCALKFHNNPYVAEEGVGFVAPGFRGHKLLFRLIQELTQIAHDDEYLQCIYGRAVMAHTLSQKSLHDFNFVGTGCILLLFPADVDYKKLSGKVAQKDSAMLMCLNLEKDVEAQTIYLPEKHTAIIQEIFRKLGICVNTPRLTPADKNKPAVGSPVKENPESHSQDSSKPVLSYQVIEVMNVADMYCHEYGIDTFSEIRQALHKLCVERIDVIYLYLNMSEEFMPHIAAQCEAAGFFFCGILPCGINGNHALIYQYLNNMTVDFDQIKARDPFSQEILNYVKMCCRETSVIWE